MKKPSFSLLLPSLSVFGLTLGTFSSVNGTEVTQQSKAAPSQVMFGDETYTSTSVDLNKADPRDPYEKLNRRVFRFNQGFDNNVFKPLAQAYKEMMPEVVSDSFSNFFNNLNQPWTAINQTLQGKYRPALKTTVRFLINTSTSLGLADAAATALNMPPDDEDFGQTLGKWGVKSGPYVMLPFLGPSTIRDGGSLVVDWAGSPLTYYSHVLRYPILGIKYTNLRASLLSLEEVMQGDSYDFVKNVYLQKRDYDVRDGVEASQVTTFGDEDSSATTEVVSPTEDNNNHADIASSTSEMVVTEPNGIPSEEAEVVKAEKAIDNGASQTIPEFPPDGSNKNRLSTDIRSVPKYIQVMKAFAL